jgi:hypothetical protein
VTPLGVSRTNTLEREASAERVVIEGGATTLGNKASRSNLRT